jgi:hypothetical protein
MPSRHSDEHSVHRGSPFPLALGLGSILERLHSLDVSTLIRQVVVVWGRKGVTPTFPSRTCGTRIRFSRTWYTPLLIRISLTKNVLKLKIRAHVMVC